MSLSLQHSNTAADGSTIDEKKSGSGHSYDNVNASMGGLVMMVLFVLLIVTAYMVYRVYMQQKYFSESYIKEYRKQAPPVKESDGQISREIPRELNDSAGGRGGLATDIYTANNINSKRELVPQTEVKQNKNIELTAKQKSSKSEKVPESKPVDPNEIEMQLGDDDEEDSDDP